MAALVTAAEAVVGKEVVGTAVVGRGAHAAVAAMAWAEPAVDQTGVREGVAVMGELAAV